MPTTQQVDHILEKVQQRLAEEEHNGVYLKVASQTLDDGWLYLVVVPTRSGVRASDYARTMAQIERELREQGDDQVLLLPTIDD